MWGSPRDLELIDRIQSTYPSLDIFLRKNEMCSAEGFKRGNRKNIYNDLIGFPIIETRNFLSFYMPKEMQSINTDNTFERISKNNNSIFRAPHLVMKQSHKKCRFYAAVLDYDAIFNHSLFGISGDEKVLKYLCIIFNSKLFSYYQLLTSRTWLVERDALEVGDIRIMPIPMPNADTLNFAAKIFNQMSVTEDEKN